MTSQQILDQLNELSSAGDFPQRTADLTAAWAAAGVGSEAIDPILKFMETNPDIDYGTPGPLVHFVESLRAKEYEQKVIKSVRRTPTFATAWMLNRIINATRSPERKQAQLAALKEAGMSPFADENIRYWIDKFIQRQGVQDEILEE